MIRLANDNLTLLYTNADGVAASISPMGGWQLYTQISANKTAQDTAASENTANQTDYLTKLHLVQVEVDAGTIDRSTAVGPGKPLMKVVSDMGVVSFVPFPNLPDLTIPKSLPSSQGLGPDVHPQTLDPQTAMLLQGILGLGAKLDALVAALKAKSVI